jgi:hypothetical protein
VSSERERELEKALREIYMLSHWLCPDYEALFNDAQEIARKVLGEKI